MLNSCPQTGTESITDILIINISEKI